MLMHIMDQHKLPQVRKYGITPHIRLPLRPSQSSVFKKTSKQNMFSFFHNQKTTLHFQMMDQGKFSSYIWLIWYSVQPLDMFMNTTKMSPSTIFRYINMTQIMLFQLPPPFFCTFNKPSTSCLLHANSKNEATYTF